MTGVSKLYILAFVLIAAMAAPALGAPTAAVTPGEATSNSIWNISASVTVDDSTPHPVAIWVTGLGNTIVLYNELWGQPGQPDEGWGNPFQYYDPASSGGGVFTYRVAVSRGLNMVRAQQQPWRQIYMQRKALLPAEEEPDMSDVPLDADNNLLLRDPRGNGMFYSSALFSDSGGAPLQQTFRVWTQAPPEDRENPEAEWPDPEYVDVTVTVHGSSYGRADYDGLDGEDGEPNTVETVLYGGTSNRDFLITYPGPSWPSIFHGPDPLTAVPAAPTVQPENRPDDGTSSIFWEFRVHYENESNLPPKPWMPSWADSYGAYESSGVVLYLGLVNPLDPSGGVWYEPHFMWPEDPSNTNYADGVDYIYRLQPVHRWGIVGINDRGVPRNHYDNGYMSLLIGTYHYFFACSDDSLTFEQGGDYYLFNYQLDKEAWGDGYAQVDMGQPTGTQWLWSSGLDPYLPWNLVDAAGNPYMPRPEGRRYTAFGDEYSPKDTQLYVDRVSKVPGLYETGYQFQYPYPSTRHPEISAALTGFNDRDIEGFGRFHGTLEPFYRAVNPTLITPWDRGGYGRDGQRMESSGATTSTTLTFKAKFYQNDNKPPVWIKTYVNNSSYKVIDATQPLTLENGGYTGYTMQPAKVQTSPGQSQVAPYNYRLGVDYEFKTQLPPGPHTYFFAAYDGKSIVMFPNRPNTWTYLGIEWVDWWVPDEIAGPRSVAEGYHNDYCPGPYINNACVLSSPSVTPATGTAGQNYKFRVLYQDADGQRPFQASVYIDTGVAGLGDNGVIKAQMVKEDPTANDFKQGVWYVADTATLEQFSVANGLRHYRFEFTDDWGRQTDTNDRIRGEMTKSPFSGGWIDGPTIGDNVRPTLTNGAVISTDGTSNGATLWKFSVDYKDMNNDAPKYVTVYIGELQADGETIAWDYGHDMAKADSGDNTYNDGCKYIYQTRLGGPLNTGDPSKTYYYAFEASDGVNLAKWVSASYPDVNARSESAGCMLQDEVATDDDLVFEASKYPFVGRLAEIPVRAGVLIDPVLWRYPDGELTSPEIASRSNDPSNPADFYKTRGVNQGTFIDEEDPTLIYYAVTRYAAADPAYEPEISEVLGVYLFEDLSGTNYYVADDSSTGTYEDGTIRLVRNLPAGTNTVWIKYLHTDGYLLDRWNGTFTFSSPQSSIDVFKADYFFATEMPTVVGGNLPPTLSTPKLTPVVGTSSTTFTYSVIYKETEGVNGQAPTFVRVVIDGTAHDMTPVATGIPSYRSGVLYKFTTSFAGGSSLNSGSHEYYFETSDGAGIVTLPAVNTSTGQITPYLGPWINDKPILSGGAADPNPTDDTISTQQPVNYTVVYSDVDNDAPITNYPYANDATATADVKALAFVTPLLFVDNEDEKWSVGKVEEIIEDAVEPGKFRSIRVSNKTGQSPGFIADEFAGKLVQILTGTLSGRVYLVVNNTTDTLRLLTDDVTDDGLFTGDMFSIGVLQMHKQDPSQQNYTAGITYTATAPQLAEGEHKFHFKAASVLTPPQWLKDLDPTYALITQSDWVRFPGANDLDGPTVEIEAPDTNRAPVLSMPTGDVPVSPVSGKTADTYQFYVTYKDDDGDPPRFHDTVLGYVRVVFNDGSFAAEMRPETAEDTANPNYFKTARRFTVTSASVPEGPHKFHFEASDGWAKTRWPVSMDASDPTVDDPEITVNYKAMFTELSVSPSSGNVNSTFSISLKYTDLDGLAPFVEGGKEQVWVEFGSSANKLYLTRGASSADFANGVIYTGAKSGLAAGNYTVIFKAKDNVGEVTTVTWPTTLKVSNNLAAPTLGSPKVYNIARPTELNANATGSSVDTFKFEVTYTDPDGDAPVVETSGVWSEGIKLYIDGQLEGIMTQKVGTSDPDFEAGVTYYYQKIGRTFQPGQHNFQFKATDGATNDAHSVQTAVTQGPTVISAAINLTRETYDSADKIWMARDPKLLETVRIRGALVGSQLKPITGSQKFMITIARPDGTGETFSITGDADNKFSFERLPAINKNWTITARWEGNADYKPAVVGELVLPVAGPSRVIATQDMSNPSGSAPAIDMICVPLTAPNRDIGTLLGFDRVRLMQIVRWDPVERTYLFYGNNYFPPLDAGAAIWVYPSSAYPSETPDPDNLPMPADPDFPVSASGRYRLYKPFGSIWSQSSDCQITVRTGWNQFGSPFMNSIALSGVKVAYQGKTVSLAQAAQNGWIRDYTWMWDATSQTYKLIHASRPDAFSRNLDPWRGYWIRSFVDCVLVVPAPGTSVTSAPARAAAVEDTIGAMNVRELAALDEPPPAPGAGR